MGGERVFLSDKVAAAEKVIQGLGAVCDHLHLVGQVVLFQCPQRQFHVGRVVLDQQDLDGFMVFHENLLRKGLGSRV